MPRPLIDLLWRAHPDAPRGGARGPRSVIDTGAVVAEAVRIARSDGLAHVTVRRLAAALGVPAMSVYTHVNSRDDLLVLMADDAHAAMALPSFGRASWRTRVRRVADANLELYRTDPWLLDVDDHRIAFGPGTIAKYDHELRAFDPMKLDDVKRDAALTFVLDFVRAAARARRSTADSGDAARTWADWSERLASYVGEDFPLARRVGAAAGAAMNAAYSPQHAYRFGLARVLDALEPPTST